MARRSPAIGIFFFILSIYAAGGCGDESTRSDGIPPARIENLRAVAIDSVGVLLIWTAPGDDGNSGPALSYDLRFAEGVPAAWDAMTQLAGEPVPREAGQADSFLVGGRTPGTSYWFRIRAADEAGNWGEPSNMASATTPGGIDRTPPAPVEDLRIAAVGPASALLTWTAPGDDGGTGTASTYDLRFWRSETTRWDDALQVEGEPAPRPAGGADSFTLAGLEPNGDYFFGLRSADESGNWSGLSAVASGRTADPDDPHWWNGFAPPPHGQGIGGSVYALVLHDGDLVAGGHFPTAGEIEARNIARWDGAAWTPLGLGTNGPIRAMAVYEGDLVVSGRFTGAGQVSADGIARWDGAAWSGLGEGEGGGPVTVFDGSLVAAGAFVQPEGPPARVARWESETWVPVGEVPLEEVTALLEYQGSLVAAGVGHAEADTLLYVVRWDGAKWDRLAWGTSRRRARFPAPIVEALLDHDGSVYAGGTVWQVEPLHLVEYVARWDGMAWSDHGFGIDCAGSPGCIVSILGLYGGVIVAGGLFDGSSGIASPAIARWTGSSWVPFGSGIRSLDDRSDPIPHVRALLEFAGSLYVAGSFEGAGRKASRSIARWDD